MAAFVCLHTYVILYMKVLDCVHIFFSGQHWRRQGSDGILYQIPKSVPAAIPPGSRTALLLNCSISSLQVGLVAQGAYNQITKFRNSHGKFKVKVHDTSIHMEQTETSVHKCTSALVSIRITCNPTFPVRRWRRLCPLSDLAPACASSIMSCFRVTLNLMFHPRSSILRQCGPNWKLRGRN